MNKPALRLFIRNIINEAKEEQKKKKEEKLPKSSGKLLDMKKSLEALKQMKEELQVAKFADKTASTEVEFSDLQKFAKELNKLKEGGVALEAAIDEKIKDLESRIDAEKNKIREMIGMTPSKDQKKIEDVKKPSTTAPVEEAKKSTDKKEDAKKKDDKKKKEDDKKKK